MTRKRFVPLSRYRSYPEDAQHLLKLVVWQIRQRITALREAGDEPEKLAGYQKNYYDLASELFRAVKDKPVQQRYRETQMYAEALAERGAPAEALKWFRECTAVDEGRRGAALAKIDEHYPDAIVTDLQMPEMNGLELVKVVSRRVRHSSGPDYELWQ